MQTLIQSHKETLWTRLEPNAPVTKPIQSGKEQLTSYRTTFVRKSVIIMKNLHINKLLVSRWRFKRDIDNFFEEGQHNVSIHSTLCIYVCGNTVTLLNKRVVCYTHFATILQWIEHDRSLKVSVCLEVRVQLLRRYKNTFLDPLQKRINSKITLLCAFYFTDVNWTTVY